MGRTPSGKKKSIFISDFETARATGYKIKYEPRGASKTLFERRDEEILLAGPAGTGKSLSILHKIHLAMTKYELAKAFMARKTRASMTNSCLDMFQRHVLKPVDGVNFHKTDQHFQYPNGSLLAVVGLDDPERIKSTEWDMGYVQEATECTENDWEMCTSRLRNFIMPYQQMLGDCNPDKPTHWLKRRCDRALTLMLESVHKDNPRLWHIGPQTLQPCSQCEKREWPHWSEKGKGYLRTLERLTGHRKSRLFQGLWVAAEGLVYTDWNPEIHRISFREMPVGWERWTHYWSIDWGYQHPFVWQDWVEHPDTHQMYRVQEIYTHNHLVEDLARYIFSITKEKYAPRAIICDHDLEDRMVFERHTGYPTLPAYKSIQPGIQAVQARLKSDWCRFGPGIIFVRDCVTELGPDMKPVLDSLSSPLKSEGKLVCTEDEFDGYVWDVDHNRLVNSKKDELPIDKDNHGMDATRYQIAFQDNLAIDPQAEEELLTLGEPEIISLY